MKTRFLALAIAVMMVFAMMPVSVAAAGTVHSVANDTGLANALNNAAEGDTIVLAAGTYAQFVVNTNNLTIKGADGADVNINITDITNGGVKYNAGNLVFENLNFVIAENATGSTWNVAALGYYYENIGPDRDNIKVINCDFINNSSMKPMAIFISDTKSYEVDGCTFNNFGTGIATMRDHSELGAVTVSDNEFVNVSTPVSVYWGIKAAANEGVLTITGNTAECDNSEPVYIITDHTSAVGREPGAIAKLIVDNEDSEVIAQDFPASSEIQATGSSKVYKAFKTEQRAAALALPGDIFYVGYETGNTQLYQKGNDGSFVEYVEPTSPINFFMYFFMKMFLSEYEITVATEGNGAVVTEAEDLLVQFGNDIVLTPVAEEGAELLSVLVDGVEVELTDAYSFENVKEAHSITFIFSEIATEEVVEEEVTEEEVVEEEIVEDAE